MGTRSDRCGRSRYNGVTHGYSSGGKRKPVYVKWQNMWQRVRQPSPAYVGITVCKRWEKFENFLQDMGEPPTGYSLDRINNAKGYSPSNCRWVPLSKQSVNRRSNKRAVFQGKDKTLTEHARDANLQPYIVLMRMKAGWSIEDALTKPVKLRASRN